MNPQTPEKPENAAQVQTTHSSTPPAEMETFTAAAAVAEEAAEVTEEHTEESEPHQTPASETWVTFVGDPFQGQPGIAPLSDASENPESDTDRDAELDLENDGEETAFELGVDAEQPRSLDEAARDYLPEETPSAEDLEHLAQLSVAMSAQNEKTLEGLSTVADTVPSLALEAPAESTEPLLDIPAADLPLDLIEACSCIEALLFISDKPLTAEKLHAALGEATPFTLIQDAITELVKEYQSTRRGFELAQVAGGYQFRTKPGRAGLAAKLAKVQTQKLSAGALESLAIIAYKQPIMKEEIDAIRGVDSSYFIRNLMERKLIKITGRSDLPGRPMVYGTSSEFLELFGLKDLGELPSLRELENMIPASSVGRPASSDPEDPRTKAMRGLVSEMNQDLSVTLAYDPKEDEQFLTEIREKVKSIPTTTATLVAQDEERKAALERAKTPDGGSEDLFVDTPIPPGTLVQSAPSQEV